jgi:hypothetical protein
LNQRAIRLDRGFRRRLEGRFGKYQFEVGVLKDGPHYKPQDSGAMSQFGMSDNLKSYAGWPARKQTREASELSLADISEANRERLGFNYIRKPFKQRSSDIIKFSDGFFKLAFGRGKLRRVENLLQAIVRNPILRGDYGMNTRATADIKGFDRLMIDTAQLFKSLKARIKWRSRV